MRLRRRVQLLLSVLAVLVASNAAFDVWLRGERDDVGSVIETQLEPAREQLGTLLTALVDQETGQRGYIITGQRSFLEPYEQGGDTADGALASLRRLLAGDDDLLAGVERVGSRVDAWRQLGAGFEIEAKEAGRDEEASALVATGTSRDLFDRARTEIAALRAAVRMELREHERRLDGLEDALGAALLAGSASGLVLLAIAVVLVRRWVTGPLAGVGAAVRMVAAGELDVRVDGTGPPEMRELAADVDAMRRRILAELDDASRAREALARRGMVVLTLRDELAPSSLQVPQGLRLATQLLPAEGVVAGDWFDAIETAPGRVTLVLVDVSGHGAASGILALRTKDLTLAALRSGLSPGEVFTWLAGQLGETDEDFLTGVVVEIDGITGALRYASAGHPALVLRDGEGTRLLGPTGPMLGPLPGRWSTVEATMTADGILVAFSDGLIEARDAVGQEFGIERVVSLVGEAAPGDPDRVVQRLLDDLQDFAPVGRPDDTTLMVLAREPVTEPAGGDRVGDPTGARP